METQSITLRIPDVTPSQNIVDRLNRWERMALRDDWYYRVKEALQTSKWDHAKWIVEPKSISILRVSTRLIDDGNVASGCKYMIDALKKYGVIANDSRKWARISFDQRKADKGESSYMEILITPLLPNQEL